ncbi:hypothetical protein J6590_017752 [Homalodisca vitripennis]|nr:hypothetical protein J6590_017752 [Homalodisca vitripennis]
MEQKWRTGVSPAQCWHEVSTTPRVARCRLVLLLHNTGDLLDLRCLSWPTDTHSKTKVLLCRADHRCAIFYLVVVFLVTLSCVQDPVLSIKLRRLWQKSMQKPSLLTSVIRRLARSSIANILCISYRGLLVEQELVKLVLYSHAGVLRKQHLPTQLITQKLIAHAPI